MGSRRAARRAGKKPKITPTAPEKTKAMATIVALKTNGAEERREQRRSAEADEDT